MFSFVLWAWLNNATPVFPPPSWTPSSESAGPLVTWDPSRDSPLTLEQIRKLLYGCPLPPEPRLAQALPYIPLCVTPNLMLVDSDEEDLECMLMCS